MVRTLEDYTRIVEEALRSVCYPSDVESLYEPIRYTVATGGKRLRPVLMLATYDWVKNVYEGDVDLSIQKAALAVELFHNFTLLHDDLMDKSALRRNQPTVWTKWSPDVALLSGDAMSILAFAQLADMAYEKVSTVLTLFSDMAHYICQGQQLDMEFEEKSDYVTQQEYLSMTEMKTAALFAHSQVIAARLADADYQVWNQLSWTGSMMGQAFQIQDDLLDTYGTTARLGKECGDDIMDNKVTFLQIYARDHANARQRAELCACRDRELPREEKVARVKAVYDAVGVREATEKEIKGFYDSALGHLSMAEKEQGRRHEFLRGILDKLADREN